MSKFFDLLKKLLEDLLTQHVDPKKIDAIQSDTQAIRAFFGIDGGLSAADQAALEEVRQQTLDLKQKAEGIDVHPPQQ